MGIGGVDECVWDVKRGNSLGGDPRPECRTSVDGMSETGVPEERGWDVKRGNRWE